MRSDITRRYARPISPGRRRSALPCGASEDGLPHTIQFMGSGLSEPLLCRIGHAYEEATDWHTRHPDL